jgi:Tol biopolymer transport system component/DNA-binding winged helix-turn-helix (wHTH) protein
LQSSHNLRFGPFELDTAAGQLRKGGTLVKLQPQPFNVLLLLAQRSGTVVTREEIQRSLWSDSTFVDFEHGINFAINQIRTALADSAERPRYVETLPRRGYRFISPVESLSAASSSSPERVPESRRGGEKPPIEPDIVQTAPAEAPTAQISRANTRVAVRRPLVAVAVCALLALVVVFARPPIPPPRVKGIHQLTHIGTVISNDNLLVSGSRLYFDTHEKGESQIRSVSLNDADAVALLEVSLPKSELLDIAPSGKELLVEEAVSGFPLSNWTRTLWRLPLFGGTPQRVGKIFSDDSCWSPDGRTIVYTNEGDQSLNLVDADGNNPRKLLSFAGKPFKPRWSPDGKIIRVSVLDSKGGGISLWQLNASGHNVIRMLSDWGPSSRAWPGRWTRDGRYFLLTGFQGGTRNIWALRDRTGLFQQNGPQPAQLTSGPINFYLPVASDDGKMIYAVGTQPHGQLMRYNAQSRQYEPFFNGLSADHLAFSHDDRWVAYITYPEGALVRSRVDGSERLQLTFPPIHALNPQWSPDGSRIAFQGATAPGGDLKLYLISVNGDSLRSLAVGTSGELFMAGWSSDGQSLIFSDSDGAASKWQLYSLNVNTGKVSGLPGTLGISAGRLSPDGKYFVGSTASTKSLILYDMHTAAARQVAELGEYVSWSSDGKYVYYSTLSFGAAVERENIGVYRIRIADGSIERAAPAPDFALTGNWGYWTGLAPDGSVLVLRELGTRDVYALDADLP